MNEEATFSGFYGSPVHGNLPVIQKNPHVIRSSGIVNSPEYLKHAVTT